MGCSQKTKKKSMVWLLIHETRKRVKLKKEGEYKYRSRNQQENTEATENEDQRVYSKIFY